MRVRPLDANGDMMPIMSLDQMKKDAQAVAQVVDLRLQFLYGEWWEDPTIGFRVPEFLVGNARSGDTDLLAKYIASYIASTEGVMAVTDVEAECNDHKISFKCEIVTNDGETEEVEVRVDGIL